MTRYRATLAYDGAGYYGFQRQIETQPSIQSTVEKAIFAVTQEAVTVIGAGRTDTGVHASGQVIAFDLTTWSRDERVLLNAINAHLPADIALQSLNVTRDNFHPRFDAISRQYVYTVIQSAYKQPLWRNRAWWVYPPLDIKALQATADLFLGMQDFASLGKAPQGENTHREVFVSFWEAHPERFGMRYVYTVEANAFLYHMVRRMVGLMVAVGSGKMTVTQAQAVLASRDVQKVKKLAPPEGLILDSVRYNE